MSAACPVAAGDRPIGECGCDVPKHVTVSHFSDRIDGSPQSEIIAEVAGQQWAAYASGDETEETLICSEFVAKALQAYEAERLRRVSRRTER